MIGAAGSAGCALYMTRHNKSYFLILLFVVWDTSPFVMLAAVDVLSKRWAALARARAAINTLLLVVTVASLAIYGYVLLGPPRPKPAAAFIMLPPVCWLLIAAVLLLVPREAR